MGVIANLTFKVHMLTVILDLTGSNVLFKLINFDSWTEEQLYDRLGQPWIETIKTESGVPPGPAAPRYLVEPIDYSKIDSRWLTSDIQIIDFGKAFFIGSPQSSIIPSFCFLAPEVLFERKASVHSDDWTLAIIIYMIRSGEPLFEINLRMFDFIVIHIANILGPFPDSWNKISFDIDGTPRHEENATNPWLSEDTPLKHPLIDLVRGIESEIEPIDFHSIVETDRGNCQVNELENILKPLSINGGNCELENILKPRNIEERESDCCDAREAPFGARTWSSEELLEDEKRHANALKISAEEAGSLYDLLSKVLRYNPEERISTAEIEKHEWFIKDFPISEQNDTD
jgi:serine/threonine protein kinase